MDKLPRTFVMNLSEVSSATDSFFAEPQEVGELAGLEEVAWKVMYGGNAE